MRQDLVGKRHDPVHLHIRMRGAQFADLTKDAGRSRFAVRI